MRKRISRFVALALSLTLLCMTVIPIGAQTLYWGSRGERVKQVQQRLKNWGYYSDSVDGVFGQKTYDAVRSFQ